MESHILKGIIGLHYLYFIYILYIFSDVISKDQSGIGARQSGVVEFGMQYCLVSSSPHGMQLSLCF